MFEQLVQDLKSMQEQHEAFTRGAVEAWAFRHASQLKLLEWSFSTDMFCRLTLALLLPVEFEDQEGFREWLVGVGWKQAAVKWDVVSVLSSVDAYDVSRNPDGTVVLTLLHLKDEESKETCKYQS